MLRILFAAMYIFPLLCFSSQAQSHGGGLNAEGCHNDRKRGTYHCHRGNSSPKRSARSKPVYVASIRSIYANCAEAREAGAAPIYRGSPGYSTKLDRDGDGVACEGGASSSSQASSSSSGTASTPVTLISTPSQTPILTAPIEGIAQVLDGDTIQIGITRIRLYGIDAFEGEQRCANSSGQSYGCGGIATRALAEQLEGKLVSCVPKGIDAYKRQLAVCRAESIDLSSFMARQGHALAYIKYSLDYVSDETFAKAELAGAHSGTFEKPWEYRLTRGAAGAEAIRQNTPPSPDCTIKGNVRSDGTRIYHMPSDLSYQKVKPENWFCDEDEAKRARFRPAYKPN
jgi:endonuclease YncB( thermonuclease family)